MNHTLMQREQNIKFKIFSLKKKVTLKREHFTEVWNDYHYENEDLTQTSFTCQDTNYKYQTIQFTNII